VTLPPAAPSPHASVVLLQIEGAPQVVE